MEYSDGGEYLDLGIGSHARLPPGGFGGAQTDWENLVHPDDRAAVLEWVDEAFKTGQPMKGEWRVVWPDRSVHWIAGRWQVLRNALWPSKHFRLSADWTNGEQKKSLRCQQAFMFKTLYRGPLTVGRHEPNPSRRRGQGSAGPE